MKMQLRQKRDGTFDFLTGTGRRVHGQYGRRPGEAEPYALTLWAMTEDPAGKPYAILREYDVTGRLDMRQLHELGEAVELLAQRRERGEPTPDDVERIDLTTR